MINFIEIVTGVLDVGVLQALVLSGVALSVVLSLLALNFPDLSIEGTFPLGATVAGVIITRGYGAGLAFVAAIVAGALGGLLTAALHTRLRMSKLLAGICTGTMLYTINLWVLGGRGNVAVMEGTYLSPFETVDTRINDLLGARGLYLHPGSILGCLVLVLCLKLAIDRLLRSEFGVVLRSVGQNETGAIIRRRSAAGYKFAGLAVANACASFAGALAAQHQGFADVNMGVGVLVLGLAAVILGQELFARLGISLTSMTALTRSALLGLVIYQILVACVLRAGVPPTSLRLLTGAALVVVIAFRQKREPLSFAW